MHDNPYRSPDGFDMKGLRSGRIRGAVRRFAAGICTLNTCAACLCILALMLVPAVPVTPEKDFAIGALVWWHLVGLPLTTFPVIWAFSSGGSRAREHLRLIIWCVILLMLWLALATFCVVVIISETGLLT
jgi:hypothetical protein